MSERRNSPRAQCRLRCSFQRGRDLIHARILDVSDAGLCLLSPVPLERDPIALQIDIPGNPPVEVEAVTWHLRQVKAKATGTTAWCVGMMVRKAGAGYDRLLPAPEEWQFNVADAADAGDDSADALGLGVFRVRVQSTTSTRTQLLTLAAASPEEARELAISDLGADWTIVDIHAA